MSKKIKLLIIIGSASLVLIAAAVFALVGFFLPYKNAQTAFDATAPLIFQKNADSSVRIEWPKANADQYLIRISDSDTVEFEKYVFDNFVTVDSLSGKRTVTVYTVGEYKWPFSKKARLRLGESPIVISDELTAPAVIAAEYSFDDVADSVKIDLELTENAAARLYFKQDGELSYHKDVETASLTIAFGEGKEFSFPEHGETREFFFDAYRKTESYEYYGTITQTPVSVTREDLLGTDLTLTLTEEDNDSVTLSWNETKGDYYLLQKRASSKQDWETVIKVEADGERVYRENGLTPYAYGEYRVIAKHSEDLEDAEPVAKTDVSALQTESVLQYSTIWNIKELELYSNPQKTEVLEKIPAGTMLCALDIDSGMFYVRHKNAYGYIDSNFCLINLPEFLGSLCKYDITNSYSSIYKFHGLSIPEVTDTVIVGYEKVKISDFVYLAPLLYPTAVKLEAAAKEARDNGYYIKIYDSFRPQAATLELYKLATEHCKRELTAEDLALIPEEERPVINGGESYTYELWVTDNGRYTLNYFLAKGVSMHNRGLAVDMTLEKNGEDMKTQSDMHDLTWHSETKQNNNVANIMAKYMKNAGFSGLISEWWHFQDNTVRDSLNPPALKNGVSLEGWFADGNGWRYRTAKNTVYKDCTRTIDGVSYTFDKNGYVAE